MVKECINAKGVGFLSKMEGRLNGERFINILKECIYPNLLTIRMDNLHRVLDHDYVLFSRTLLLFVVFQNITCTSLATAYNVLRQQFIIENNLPQTMPALFPDRQD